MRKRRGQRAEASSCCSCHSLGEAGLGCEPRPLWLPRLCISPQEGDRRAETTVGSTRAKPERRADGGFCSDASCLESKQKMFPSQPTLPKQGCWGKGDSRIRWTLGLDQCPMHHWCPSRVCWGRDGGKDMDTRQAGQKRDRASDLVCYPSPRLARL